MRRTPLASSETSRHLHHLECEGAPKSRADLCRALGKSKGHNANPENVLVGKIRDAGGSVRHSVDGQLRAGCVVPGLHRRRPEFTNHTGTWGAPLARENKQLQNVCEQGLTASYFDEESAGG